MITKLNKHRNRRSKVASFFRCVNGHAFEDRGESQWETQGAPWRRCPQCKKELKMEKHKISTSGDLCGKGTKEATEPKPDIYGRGVAGPRKSVSPASMLKKIVRYATRDQKKKVHAIDESHAVVGFSIIGKKKKEGAAITAYVGKAGLSHVDGYEDKQVVIIAYPNNVISFKFIGCHGWGEFFKVAAKRAHATILAADFLDRKMVIVTAAAAEISKKKKKAKAVKIVDVTDPKTFEWLKETSR